jgi:hypothetical protein
MKISAVGRVSCASRLEPAFHRAGTRDPSSSCRKHPTPCACYFNAPAALRLNWIIAHRFPPKNQVPFFAAAGRLPSGAIVDVDVGGAVGDCVFHLHMTFEPLMQVPCLRDVDRNPSPIPGLAGIDIIARQWLKGSINRIAFVLVFLAGLARPMNRGRREGLRLPVTTK